ncbi:MAG TPA: hypothetical protein VNA19_00430 [Pyrinomonadaceae bacterium]|jgi:hypothetical protein|nr:hypothetical protein [Pyrinomonadaceae bacterium]
MPERKATRTRRRAAANGNGNENTAMAIVRDVTRENAEIARENIRSVSRQPAMRGDTPAPTQGNIAADSDVTPQLTGAGTAFGSFVEKVGLAVAAAQKELDKTLVDTAKALSEAKIEVIAVYEQVLDEKGMMTDGNAKMATLPLVNYVTPTVYQWSRVYLESNMNVSEFNADTGFKIQNKSDNFNVGARASYGLFSGFSAGGGFNYGSSSNSISVDTETSVNTAAGSMHMEATLEPRGDLTLPKPFVLQKGPTVRATITKIENMMDNSDPKKPVVNGKRATVLITVKKQDGSPNTGVELDYTIDQPLINHTVDSLKTNNDGTVTVTLERTGPAFADPSKPMPVLMKVWLGLVSDDLGINL